MFCLEVSLADDPEESGLTNVPANYGQIRIQGMWYLYLWLWRWMTKWMIKVLALTSLKTLRKTGPWCEALCFLWLVYTMNVKWSAPFSQWCHSYSTIKTILPVLHFLSVVMTFFKKKEMWYILAVKSWCWWRMAPIHVSKWHQYKLLYSK